MTTFWETQLKKLSTETIVSFIREVHPSAEDITFCGQEEPGHYIWLDGTHHCSINLIDPPAWFVMRAWEHLQSKAPRKQTEKELERLRKLAETSKKPRNRPAPTKDLIRSYIAGLRPGEAVTTEDTAKKTGASMRSVWDVFRELKEAGILFKEGSARGGFTWTKVETRGKKKRISGN